MKFFKTAALAASTLVVSGGAFAAVNPDAVHLALDSLLVATSKAAIFRTTQTDHRLPSTNAEAHLGAPSTMTTNEISGIVVNKGGIINVYLSPATGTDHGLVRYIPKLVDNKKGKKTMLFDCVSPNIPEISKITPTCAYASANQPAEPASQPKKK